MKFLTLDPAVVGQAGMYRLMIGGVIPRPIAWLSTVSSQGQGNLAPFSFFNGVSSSPPALMVSIAEAAHGGPKHTLKNILDTREFVVNLANQDLAMKMHQSSANYPDGVDEMIALGLTPADSQVVKPKRVLESPLQFECRLLDTLKVGRGVGSSTIVVGEIVMAHVWDSAYQNQPSGPPRLLPTVLDPVARLGGTSYTTLGKIFDLPAATLLPPSKP